MIEMRTRTWTFGVAWLLVLLPRRVWQPLVNRDIRIPLGARRSVTVRLDIEDVEDEESEKR